jgi:hypothetical protein
MSVYRITTYKKRGAAMTKQMPPTAAAYVRAINDHDPVSFDALFTDGAVVNDVGREFRGRPAIKAWSDREIFDAEVTLEVLGVAERDGETVVTTKVYGNFDRTGLPDPVLIDHSIKAKSGKIDQLTCRLKGDRPQT